MVLGLTARQTPILTYHAVSSSVDPRFARYAVTPVELDAQLRWLREAGYETLSVSAYSRALHGERPLPERRVVLTFDDAFQDFATLAMPVLTRHGAGATLYVPTAFVGGRSAWADGRGEGRRPMMSWEQLRDAHAGGIEIGGHSHAHVRLSGLAREEVLHDVAWCKQLLELAIGSVVETFAYPFGDHDASVRAAVREAGYATACEVGDLPSTDADDRFALRRLIVPGGLSLERFRALVARRAGPLERIGRGLKSRVGRTVRSVRGGADAHRAEG